MCIHNIYIYITICRYNDRCVYIYIYIYNSYIINNISNDTTNIHTNTNGGRALRGAGDGAVVVRGLGANEITYDSITIHDYLLLL